MLRPRGSALRLSVPAESQRVLRFVLGDESPHLPVHVTLQRVQERLLSQPDPLPTLSPTFQKQAPLLSFLRS